MKQSIKIGKGKSGNIELDIPSLVGSRLLVQANSGGGKSWPINQPRGFEIACGRGEDDSPEGWREI